MRDRLAQGKHVRLCTVRPDGSPHVTPVRFVLDPEEVADAFAERYGWDGTAPHTPHGDRVLLDRVLLEVPVCRRWLAGVAQ